MSYIAMMYNREKLFRILLILLVEVVILFLVIVDYPKLNLNFSYTFPVDLAPNWILFYSWLLLFENIKYLSFRKCIPSCILSPPPLWAGVEYAQLTCMLHEATKRVSR